jgi:hypothetical protein
MSSLATGTAKDRLSMDSRVDALTVKEEGVILKTTGGL